MFNLIIEDDEGKTTVAPLIRKEITIGRAEGNSIRLTERNVSRNHARLWIEENKIFIKDLNSYNGLWSNGSQVFDKTVLSPGDLIEIGDYHLTIQSEKKEDAGEARPSLPLNKATAITPPAGLSPYSESAKAPPPMLPARLVIQNTEYAGQGFMLQGRETLIGRSEDENTIAIEHPSVSRQHAQIVQEGNSYKIVDLESANGVRVNGEDYLSCNLRWGDIIELGNVRLRFVAPGEELPPRLSSTQEIELLDSPATGMFNGKDPKGVSLLVVGFVVGFLILGGFAAFMLLSKKGKRKVPRKIAAIRTLLPSKIPPIAPSKKPETRSESVNSASMLSSSELIEAAKAAFKQESYVESLRWLSELEGKEPEAAGLEPLRNKIFYERGQLKKLREGLELQEKDEWFKSYEKYGLVEEQSRYYKRALSLRKSMGAHVIRQLSARIKLSMQEKRFVEALQFNQTILSIEPNNLMALKRSKFIKRKMPGAVTPPTRRALKRRVKSSKRAILEPGKRKKPSPLLKKSEGTKPPKKRLSLCDRLIAMHPKKISSRMLSKAQRCFKTSLRRKKNVGDAFFGLGVISARFGRCCCPMNVKYRLDLCERAIDYYRAYLRKEPNGRYAKLVRKHLRSHNVAPKRTRPIKRRRAVRKRAVRKRAVRKRAVRKPKGRRAVPKRKKPALRTGTSIIPPR